MTLQEAQELLNANGFMFTEVLPEGWWVVTWFENEQPKCTVRKSDDELIEFAKGVDAA